MESRTPLEMLVELDSRHDELLDRLSDLDKQVKTVLAECQPSSPQLPPLQGGDLSMAPTLDGVL